MANAEAALKRNGHPGATPAPKPVEPEKAPADEAAPEAEEPEPAEAEAADDAPADGEETDTEPESEAAKATGIGLSKALAALTAAQHVALMRANWTDEDMQAAPSAEWLTRHADREAAIEARNKAAYEAAKQPKPAEGKKRPLKTEAEPAVSPSAEPVSDALPEPVREELSEKAATALEKWVSQRFAASEREATAARERADQLEATLEQGLAATRGQVVQRDVRDIRAELQAQWPELAAPAVWSKVLTQAKAIAPGYEHFDDETLARRTCLSHAARNVLGDPPDAKKPEPAKKPAPPKAPTLTRPGSRPARERKLTAAQQSVKNAQESLRAHGLNERNRRRTW